MTRIHTLLLSLLLTTLPPLLHAQQPAVHAVLFYSPTCPHCHQVIKEHLIPLQEKYGDRLVILGINTMKPDGRRIYRVAMDQFTIPDKDRGVPALVVGERLLQGSLEIPESFPVILADGLTQGGIGWPDIPGLREVLGAQVLIAPTPSAVDSDDRRSSSTAEKLTTKQELEIDSPLELTLTDKLARDPAGNTLAIVVLSGMVFSLCFVGYLYISAAQKLTPWPRWSIPALLPIGLGVAAYLSFVEVNQVEAVCGPVGDCNTVQQSPYAYLFGVVPMALLGLMAYIAIGLSWAVQHYGPQRWRRATTRSTLGLTLIGTLFSIYLTFLEPFVIGATCIWCLTSAVIMTLMLWAAATTAKQI